MGLRESLKFVAENSNSKMIVRKVPASKQPSAETINNLNKEIGAMIRENDRVAYNSMNLTKEYGRRLVKRKQL